MEKWRLLFRFMFRSLVYVYKGFILEKNVLVLLFSFENLIDIIRELD